MIKCKDYNIIKIRYYADKRLLDKYYQEENETGIVKALPKQHYERAESYIDFQYKLVEHVLGYTIDYIVTTYRFDGLLCMFDEMQEKLGIRFQGGEAQAILMVPKDNDELFDWIKANLKNPYKVVKKVHLGYLGYDHDLKWRREWSLRESKVLMEKFNLKENEKVDK